MNKNNKKKAEFARLYSSGKHSQKELAAKFEISEQTAVKWAKELNAESKKVLRITAMQDILLNEAERLTANISTSGTPKTLQTVLNCAALLESIKPQKTVKQ